jgi:type I restriction enzyme R subunit
VPGAIAQRRPGDYDIHPLWAAFAKLEAGRVKGQGPQAPMSKKAGSHLLTDLITLVRHALGQVPDLEPYAEQVRHRFEEWLARQTTAGSTFTDEQRKWLEAISSQIASSLSMEREDFRYDPFSTLGGLGKARALFGDRLDDLLGELNRELVA